jgi:hypothetical protein
MDKEARIRNRKTPRPAGAPAAIRPRSLFAVLLLAGPLLSGLAGCRELEVDEEEVARIFRELHRRIYEVYRLQDPGEIFDLLARSLEGPELEKQVFEYLKCLRVQANFRTKISILDVIYNDIRLADIDERGVRLYCKWVVIGKIRHPTHIHRKNNLNEAYYWLRLGDGGPRIVGYELITNQGLEVTTR